MERRCVLIGLLRSTKLGLGGHDNTNNDTKQTKSTPEDLDDQDLDEEFGPLCISQRASSAHNTDTNARCSHELCASTSLE